ELGRQVALGDQAHAQEARAEGARDALRERLAAVRERRLVAAHPARRAPAEDGGLDVAELQMPGSAARAALRTSCTGTGSPRATAVASAGTKASPSARTSASRMFEPCSPLSRAHSSPPRRSRFTRTKCARPAGFL